MNTLRNERFWGLFLPLIGMGVVLQAAAPERVASPAKLVLTSIENGTEPQSEFYCSGKIHGYIRLPERIVGPHVLEGTWVLPNGKPAAESRTRVDYPPTGRSTAYIWFEFPGGGLLDGIQPDADAQRQQYPGLWRVEVRWDDQLVLRSSFTVLCH